MSDTLQEREEQIMWTHAALECADETCPCHEWLRRQSEQPAARGGGDEGELQSLTVGQLLDKSVWATDPDERVNARLEILNQYQSLVAEREQIGNRLQELEQAAATAIGERNDAQSERDRLQRALITAKKMFEYILELQRPDLCHQQAQQGVLAVDTVLSNEDDDQKRGAR